MLVYWFIGIVRGPLWELSPERWGGLGGGESRYVGSVIAVHFYAVLHFHCLVTTTKVRLILSSAQELSGFIVVEVSPAISS